MPGTTAASTVETVAAENSEPQLKPNYNIKADVQVSGNVVKVKEEIFLNKPQSKIIVYVPSENAAKTNIKQIFTNSGFKKEIIGDTNLMVNCDKPQEKIGFEYELYLESRQSTLAYAGNIIMLTNFLLTPAVFRNGSPVYTYKWSFGDPYIYGMNSYHITFRIPKDLNIFAPGEKSETIEGDSRVATCEAANMRDFPAVISSAADVSTQKLGNTSIYYINSSISRDFISKAFEFASDRIGPYPYKELFVVNAPISNEGMEFSNMVFLSDKCFNNMEVLKRVAYHEVFHQWFYGIIGTDQLNEPFLDEGLVNYLSMFLCNDTLEESFDGRFLNMHLNNYKTREEYYNLAYNNSSVYFYLIHKKIGDKFFNMLKKVYNDKKFSTLYFDEFLKYAD